MYKLRETTIKDFENFIDMCHLLDSHPESTGSSVTIKRWCFKWVTGDYIKITDLKLDKVILHVTRTSSEMYTTWHEAEQVLQNPKEDLNIIFERAIQLERFVTENLKYAPSADKEVLRFIGNFLYHGVPGIDLETSCESVRSTFRAGYCYYFAVMLRVAFKRGAICQAYPFGHIVWVDDDGTPYDIEGVYFGEATKFVPVEQMGESLNGFMHIRD